MKKAHKENTELHPNFHDDFDATIIKSWFGFEERNRSTTTPSLIFTLKEKDGGMSQVAFNTGSGWQIVEDGRRVEHNIRKNFVVNSIMGHLVTRVIKNLEMRMWERGNPRDADVWMGLKFHWKMEEIDLSVPLPNEKPGKITHLMPTEFLRGYKFSSVTEPEESLQLPKGITVRWTIPLPLEKP